MAELDFEGEIDALEVLEAITDGVRASLPEMEKRDVIDAISDGVGSFLLDEIGGKLFVDAFRDGVHGAIWRMITNATDAPCADFYEAVSKGIKEAIMEMDLSDVIGKSV